MTSSTTTAPKATSSARRLSLRGIDNQSYYRLEDGGVYVNYTGCGNTLDLRNPHMLQLVTDSLRYWATEMHVDGFRFDLAPTLARTSDAFDAQSSFLEAINQDPVLSQVKLIAEPWDIGPGGYQVGNFPAPWSEWNDRFRNTTRDFWLCGATDVQELGYRLSGSSDLYQGSGRLPDASINFVACHDGFTLHDLVTYNDKVNEANGENNRDGSDDNHNWNCGHEGETDDPLVTQIRQRVVRAILGTLVLSAGVPMLGHGDEMGRTQRGNNNAYCQDNALAWVDWSARDESLVDFTRASHRAAARTRRVPARLVLHRHVGARHRRGTARAVARQLAPPTSRGSDPTARSWRRPTGPISTRARSRCTCQATTFANSASTASRCRRLVPGHHARRSRPVDLHAARRAVGNELRGRARQHRPDE